MRKYLLILPIAIILIFSVITVYLSFFGLKTDKFNKLIYFKISQISPNLSAEINDVFIRLDVKEQLIKLEASNIKLQVTSEPLFIDKITFKMSILNFLNKNKIQSLEISTREDEITNIKRFISEYDFNFSRELILNQIKEGRIKANIFLDFRDQNEIYNYNIIGKVKGAQINLLNKGELENISFNFKSNQKKHLLNNLKFTYENVDFISKDITVKKIDNSFLINGDISNKKHSFDIQKIQKYFNYNLNLIKNSKINLSSNNKFSFSLVDKKFEKFKLKSNITFDEIKFKETLNLPININNGEAKIDYKNEFLEINIKSKYYFLRDEKKQSNLGDAKFLVSKKKNENIKIKGNFYNSGNKLNTKQVQKILNFDSKHIPDQNLQFDSTNLIQFELNNRREIEKYKINSKFKINELEIFYKDKNLKSFFPEYKNKVFLKDNLIEINIDKKIKDIKFEGLFSLDNILTNGFKINLVQNSEILDFDTYINLNNIFINFNSLDYRKKKETNSNLILNGRYKKNLTLKKIKYTENSNILKINNLTLSNKGKIKNLDSVILDYENIDKKLNNLKFEKKKNNLYQLSGNEFDAQKLIVNNLGNKNTKSFFEIFENLNTKILIHCNNILIDKNNTLTNLDGEISLKGKSINFAKINSNINSKNNFSLTIRTNTKNEKITNLFIEEPAPFIKNYKFVKGFTGGKLSYGSIEKNNKTKANLKIYDFKVQEVSILAKLLTLASLQGIADLLTGEGIRFKEFEMDYESTKSHIKIDEMHAIGPAISILMEGYIEKSKLVSLRGTLVPATTINKTISKIPLLGDILVGKKVGEGVFGVSFKIKGPPENLKTSVNPIKTLTPRFITRTLEKLKN